MSSVYLRAPGSKVVHLAIWAATGADGFGVTGTHQPLCGSTAGQVDSLLRSPARSWTLTAPNWDTWRDLPLCLRCRNAVNELNQKVFLVSEWARIANEVPR